MFHFISICADFRKNREWVLMITYIALGVFIEGLTMWLQLLCCLSDRYVPFDIIVIGIVYSSVRLLTSSHSMESSQKHIYKVNVIVI